MSSLKGLFSQFFLFVILFFPALSADAGVTDPNVIWPLCGRIAENPPPGWVDNDGCPANRAGDAAYSDEPLSASFGPRPLFSENNRYDFHRGVDIATPIGTPFFAIADGRVDIAGNDPSYSDPLVKLRHFRPGETSCSPTGCYYSLYLHISEWVVNANDQVVKGQLLGYTGASSSAFEHLHFEVRDAPAFDVASAWSRDAVHPLSVVPYSAPNNTAIQFNAVDLSVPNAGVVDLTVTSNRFDLVKVDVSLFDGNHTLIPQPGDTPDANGYLVNPSSFDMQTWNFMYSHKDSTNFPWESFGAGGVNQCPYHAGHGASYDANVHMDEQYPGNPLDGLFNGVHIRTQKYWPSDVDNYTIDLEFLALQGPAACVEATALFASGDSTISRWGNCDGAPNQSPSAAMTWSCQGFACAFDGSPSSDPDGSISGYAWDFGDGTFDSGVNPGHVFPGAGSWQVNLTVTDNGGAADNHSETVSVTEPLLVRGPYLQMQTEDGITIHWRTDTATDSVVRYGTSAGNLTSMVADAAVSTEHKVRLTGLDPARQYWYSVGDSVATIAGDASYHFHTAPLRGTTAATRVWALGDSGTANASARSVRDAYKAWSGANPADFVLMLGDNAYNDGTDNEYQAAVFDTYPEVLRQLPLWPVLGNHDGHSADSATQSGPYYDIFELPKNAEVGGLASGTEAYYSFDYANIHFVALDSYDTDRSAGGGMMTWLQNDLAMNTTQPWVIAFWHHPPYSKGSHDSDTEAGMVEMRENALPILEDWGVDLVLSGHSHSYERSYLLDGHYGNSLSLDPDINVLDPGDGQVGSDGPYEKPDMVAAPRAGAVYTVAGSSGKVSGGSLDHPAMYVSLATLGSVLIDVSGSRMDVRFLDGSGVVEDEFSIQKGADLDPPLVNSAQAEDANHVLVNFNEALDPLEAGKAANFSIAGLLTNTAELLPDTRTVRLTTSSMTSGNSYTVIVDNVQDLALNTILPGSSANFDYNEVMSASFQDGIAPSTAYDGTMDAYIREATADTLYGLETTLQVDGSEPSGSETDMNIVLAWDISSIPSGATVVSADIDLEVTNASTGSYTCYSLLTAWEQSQVSWNQASTGIPWGAPGASSAADRGVLPVCTVLAGSTGSLNVPLNNDGLAMIQNWIDYPGSNHGIVIADPSTGDGADFHSSESANALARPRLNIVYSVAPVSNADPVAGFTFVCTDLDCDFTDTSTDSDGSVVTWDWDFGDGNTSGAQNPLHSYAAGGSYTVSLTVTDNQGGTDSSSQNNSVTAPNQPPVASFGSNCTGLDCVFTDTSSDSDGSVVSWDWDFGDGSTSSAQNPLHSYATGGTYSVSLTVTDDSGAGDSDSVAVTVAEPPLTVDYTAIADLPSAGSVNGSFVDTYFDDDTAVQSITERESGGKRNQRHSYLSHTWQFNVAPATTVTVIANAWSGGSSDGDSFRFEWSTDNSNFTQLFIVASSDPSNLQSAVIAASGTLYIRVTDTDQTQGANALDTIYVDQLIIRGDSSVPSSPPDVPLDLQVDAVTASTITLSWQHDDDSEQAFDLQRKLSSSGSWPAGSISVGGGSTAYTDTGLAAETAFDYRIRAINSAGNSAWSNIASGSTLALPAISLSANGYKVKGVGYVDLDWSGAGSSQVDIVRDGVVIDTVPGGTGSYTDNTGIKGAAAYVYRVCEAGTATCSNDVNVGF